MGNKQLKLLLIVFAILVVAVAALKMARRSTIEAPMTGVGEKVIPDFPVNEIRPAVIEFPRRTKVKKLTIRITEREPHPRWPRCSGLAEIRLEKK